MDTAKSILKRKEDTDHGKTDNPIQPAGYHGGRDYGSHRGAPLRVDYHRAKDKDSGEKAG